MRCYGVFYPESCNTFPSKELRKNFYEALFLLMWFVFRLDTEAAFLQRIDHTLDLAIDK